jgi:hypothetical protein
MDSLYNEYRVCCSTDGAGEIVGVAKIEENWTSASSKHFSAFDDSL